MSDIKKIEILKTQQLVSGPSYFEIEIAIENLKIIYCQNGFK